MTPEANDGHWQLYLFDPDTALKERLTAMAAANENGNRKPKYVADPGLDAIQARNKEDGAGFTQGAAAEAVAQAHVQDIVTKGTKRARELRKQRTKSNGGREHTNVRDDRRDLAPAPYGTADPIILNDPEAIGLTNGQVDEHTQAEINTGFKAFHDRTKPPKELTSEAAQTMFDCEFGDMPRQLSK